MILETEIDGLLYSLDTDEQEAMVKKCVDRERTGEVVIPESFFHEGIVYRVTKIGKNAFRWCRSLTSITLPKGVTSIRDCAFWGCHSLINLTFPESITGVGEWAFCDCSSLTSVIIPESVTSIGRSAFSGCSSLTSITLPNGVTSIGDGAFSGCSSLTAVHISSIKAWCKISFGNYTSNPLCKAHNLHLNGELITELVIPEGVTIIGDYIFCGCSSLTSITLPEGVMSIGKSTFNGCSSLTSITIPESVTNIGDEAFWRCNGLTVITIPDNVTSIGEWAFSDCNSLTSIIVAEGNKMYDSREGCNAIIETASNTLIRGCSKTIIPESVTSIGRGAFDGCSSLTSITLPKGVTSIGYGAFFGCSCLTSITLPKDVKSIEEFAFKKSGITYLTILGKPSIGEEAFEGCKKLTDVYCYSTEVPPAESAFSDFFNFTPITLYLSRITLHVPESALEAYKNTEPWSRFGTIVAIK